MMTITSHDYGQSALSFCGNIEGSAAMGGIYALNLCRSFSNISFEDQGYG
jgi:hypothetical protein